VTAATPKLVVTSVVWGAFVNLVLHSGSMAGLSDWRFWALSSGAFIVYFLGGVSR